MPEIKNQVSVAIIFNSDNRILVGKRPKDKPLAGFWEFPGGKIEIGETAVEALKRELFEELYLREKEDYLINDFIGVFKSKYKDRDFDLNVFICKANSKISIGDHPVHEEIKFLTKEEILNLNLIPSNIKIIKKIGSI